MIQIEQIETEQRQIVQYDDARFTQQLAVNLGVEMSAVAHMVNMHIEYAALDQVVITIAEDRDRQACKLAQVGIRVGINRQIDVRTQGTAQRHRIITNAARG